MRRMRWRLVAALGVLAAVLLWRPSADDAFPLRALGYAE
jgi:hypothetical protein